MFWGFFASVFQHYDLFHSIPLLLFKPCSFHVLHVILITKKLWLTAEVPSVIGRRTGVDSDELL